MIELPTEHQVSFKPKNWKENRKIQFNSENFIMGTREERGILDCICIKRMLQPTKYFLGSLLDQNLEKS